MRIPVPVICVALLAPIPSAVAQQAAFNRLTALEQAIDASFDGDRALAIVAELDPLWRWPGNEPYQKAISIIERELVAAGFVNEADAPAEARLVYRVEHRTEGVRAWEPIDGALQIVGAEAPVLEFTANRNMIAIGSVSTPDGGVEAELISLIGRTPEQIAEIDLRGKIILADMPAGRVAAIATERGAIGALAYSIPDYNQPEVQRDSIPFSGIRAPEGSSMWAINLSHRARAELIDALNRGPVTLRAIVKTRSYPGDDQTLIAEIRGSVAPESRIVFSAHVQEPGANDNASGVACQAEMARTAAILLRTNVIDPKRTITMLWGNEIQAIARYLKEDPQRTENILFGISLDMVGQDTGKTGGSFLIEKLPDPSAIWTRGQDKHSEWGAGEVKPEDFVPHFLTDYMLSRCNRRAQQEPRWVVNTNPYEGGSDHVPFLRSGVPSVLLWHFTDVYYHTDGDRIENVSPVTMKHVGVSALTGALAVASADSDEAMLFGGETLIAAIRRIEAEVALSAAAVAAGADPAEQRRIVEAWRDWYVGAIESLESLPVGGPSAELRAWLRQMSERIRETHEKYIQNVDNAAAARRDEPGAAP